MNERRYPMVLNMIVKFSIQRGNMDPKYILVNAQLHISSYISQGKNKYCIP